MLRLLIPFACTLGLATGAAPDAARLQDPHGDETLEHAVERLFPESECERSTAYLGKELRARVRELTGEDEAPGLVYPYEIRRKGKLLATAYLDRHRVRSKGEILMVVVKPDGSLHSVSVLAFGEPRKYLPVRKWYAQFQGTSLDRRPRVGRNIDGITGATLTTSATEDAATRILAVHHVLNPPPEDEEDPDDEEPGGDAPESGGAPR